MSRVLRLHFSKVIMNILHNALEAMPAGGKIVIATADISVDTTLSGYEIIPPGDYVCTTVSDNGVGIAAGDLIRIFEPFYTKKSMQFSGTGLGMTVIWATIKDHNGYIDIKSTEGEGTTFTFYLPISRSEPGQSSMIEWCWTIILVMKPFLLSMISSSSLISPKICSPDWDIPYIRQ